MLCTLTVDDHTSASGVKRYMLGGEPILTRDGGELTDGHGHHPYVTTAGSAPSLGTHLRLAYLPTEEATIGTELAVSYMEQTTRSRSAPSTPPRSSTPPTCGSDEMTSVLVCIKRVVDSSSEVVLTEDGSGRRRPLRRLHDERAHESAVESRRPDRRRH